MTFSEALGKAFSDGVFLASLLGFTAYELSRGYDTYWKKFFAEHLTRNVILALLIYALIISLLCSLISLAAGANWLGSMVFGFTFPSSAAEMQQRLRKMDVRSVTTDAKPGATVSAEDTTIREVPISQQIWRAFSDAVSLSR